jgi:hypothetical protein
MCSASWTPAEFTDITSINAQEYAAYKDIEPITDQIDALEKVYINQHVPTIRSVAHTLKLVTAVGIGAKALSTGCKFVLLGAQNKLSSSLETDFITYLAHTYNPLPFIRQFVRHSSSLNYRQIDPQGAFRTILELKDWVMPAVALFALSTWLMSKTSEQVIDELSHACDIQRAVASWQHCQKEGSCHNLLSFYKKASQYPVGVPDVPSLIASEAARRYAFLNMISQASPQHTPDDPNDHKE